MEKITKYLWVIIVIGAIFGYCHWVSDYNESLSKWEPIVEECSNHGGFMTAEGVCDFNQ